MGNLDERKAYGDNLSTAISDVGACEGDRINDTMPPLGTSNNLLERARARGGKLAEAIRKHVEKLDDRFNETPLAEACWTIRRGTGNAVRELTEGIRCAHHGYGNMDVWNCGNRLVSHVAQSTEVALERGAIRDTEDGAIATSIRTLRLLNDASSYDMDILDLMDPLNSQIDDAIAHELRDAWDYIGNLVMTGDRVVPVAEREEVAEDASHTPRRMPDVINRAMGRTPDGDVAMFPVAELRRTASLLEAYARRNFGTPIEYADRFPHVGDLPDGWDRGKVPPSIVWFGNSDVLRHAMRQREARTGKSCSMHDLLIEELDRDYVALVLDVHATYDAITRWANWLEGMLGIGDDHIPGAYETISWLSEIRDADAEDDPVAGACETIGTRLREEFLDAWHWLGACSQSLWV